MITVTTNISTELNKVAKKLNPDLIRDKLLRAVSSAVFAEMKVRIYKNGIDSDGNPIGTYEPNYLKKRIKRGYDSSTKVILSFSRDMQNGMIIMHDGKDYGIGFINEHERNKVEWNEEHFNKVNKIFHMTEAEKELANKTAREELHRLIAQR